MKCGKKSICGGIVAEKILVLEKIASVDVNARDYVFRHKKEMSRYEFVVRIIDMIVLVAKFFKKNSQIRYVYRKLKVGFIVGKVRSLMRNYL